MGDGPIRVFSRQFVANAVRIWQELFSDLAQINPQLLALLI